MTVEGLRAEALSIPADAGQVFAVTGFGGVRLAAYELPPLNGSGPVLIWAHANGFASGSYLPLLLSLARDFRVFAYDARGQGGAALPPEPFSDSVTLPILAQDLSAVAASVRARVGDDRPFYFCGHSFGGTTALHLHGVRGEAVFRGMTVIEPPIFPGEESPLLPLTRKNIDHLVGTTRTRRSVWQDPETYRAAMARRKPFAEWDQAMLAAHARATLHPRAEGGDYALSCPPDVEMSVYQAVGRDLETFGSLRNVDVAVHVVVADPLVEKDSWVTDIQPEVAGRLPKGRLTVAAGHSHLFPFEDAAKCRELVTAML